MKRQNQELLTASFGAVYLGKQQRRAKRNRKLLDKKPRRSAK